MFEGVIARAGPLPTLIEWDNDVPDWPVLLAEALAAQRRLDQAVPLRAAPAAAREAPSMSGGYQDVFAPCAARPQCRPSLAA